MTGRNSQPPSAQGLPIQDEQAMKDIPSRNTIAVVGGGMTGIAAAMRLASSGRHAVTLFEKADRLGGLSTFYTWGDVSWDRFYHVILSTDAAMLDLVHALGLANSLFWRETRSGFYGDGRLVPMSSSMDFLRFPFMSLWQKCRMVLGILYSSRIRNPEKLDRIYVREWLTRVFGRRVYENIWEPLLRSKLGEAREHTSAAFIWATINRLYGARGNGGSKKEKMGHVAGGYRTILEAAENKLAGLGVTIHKGCPVQQVDRRRTIADGAADVSPGPLILRAGERSFPFDQVLLTVDCPEALSIIGDASQNGSDYWRQLREVHYLGVICVFLVVAHRLSPYYVINLLDKTLPFTGIIEATNVVSPESFVGRHIVYLPKYVTADDPIREKTDTEIIALFVSGLKRVYPSLEEASLLHCRVFRAGCVQPLQELNYLERTAGFQTPLPSVFLANTSMIHNSTLNNNAAISLAHRAVDTIIDNIAS